MLGIKKLLETGSRQNNYQIKKLHDYLDELDRRRGTDWRSLFPHLIV